MKRLMRRSVNRLGYDVQKISSLDIIGSLRRKIYFLHIGKNAGTQIAQLATQIEAQTGVKVVQTSHAATLAHLPQGSRYFFSVRDPVSRFRSAFYSRKRQGRPRLNSAWSAHEAIAFADFEHANDLAENLFARGERGRKACQAVQSITHSAMQQVDWFKFAGYFLEESQPIWIVRQEHFAEDFGEFLKRAGLGVSLSQLEITSDPVKAHRNDYASIPELSDLAKANLRKWYARDVEFYRICTEWMDAQKAAG